MNEDNKYNFVRANFPGESTVSLARDNFEAMLCCCASSLHETNKQTDAQARRRREM